MKYIFPAAVLSIAAFGNPQDDLPVPKELESPRVAKGSAVEFLKTFTQSKFLSERAEGRHAALYLIESLPDTRQYLGSTLTAMLRDDMKRAVLADVEAMAWADTT